MSFAAPVDTPSVDEIDGHWWITQSEHTQDVFVLGYITASYVWAESLWIVYENEGTLSPGTGLVYETLGPVVEELALNLSRGISMFYEDRSTRDLEVYRVINSLVVALDERREIEDL